jgi:hypothetical protein
MMVKPENDRERSRVAEEQIHARMTGDRGGVMSMRWALGKLQRSRPSNPEILTTIKSRGEGPYSHNPRLPESLSGRSQSQVEEWIAKPNVPYHKVAKRHGIMTTGEFVRKIKAYHATVRPLFLTNPNETRSIIGNTIGHKTRMMPSTYRAAKQLYGAPPMELPIQEVTAVEEEKSMVEMISRALDLNQYSIPKTEHLVVDPAPLASQLLALASLVEALESSLAHLVNERERLTTEVNQLQGTADMIEKFWATCASTARAAAGLSPYPKKEG